MDDIITDKTSKLHLNQLNPSLLTTFVSLFMVAWHGILILIKIDEYIINLILNMFGKVFS